MLSTVLCTDHFNFGNANFNNSSIQNFGNTNKAENKNEPEDKTKPTLNTMSAANPQPLTITGNAFQHSNYNNILGNWYMVPTKDRGMESTSTSEQQKSHDENHETSSSIRSPLPTTTVKSQSQW